jgi:hypothetical protein
VYQYDPKRYKIAPWKGTFGDQAHAKRVHPHVKKIKRMIKEKKLEMRRLEEQVNQLETLLRNSDGKIVDGVLVAEDSSKSQWYGISLVTSVTSERRYAKVYPNAHNGGKTFGYHIHWGSYPFSKEEWRGTGHTLEQAVAGARAWVLRGERLPARYDRTDGTIYEVA